MSKVFTSFMVLVLLYISGCGADEDAVEVIEDIPVNLVAVYPYNRDVISPNSRIFLVFDSVPTQITSTVGEVELLPPNTRVTTHGIRDKHIDKPKIQITGPFPGGLLELIVRWADGEKSLSYFVTVPCADPEIDAGCN